MIVIKYSGNFKNTEKFLKQAEKIDYTRILAKYGQEGVAALSAATPIDSGMTATSWDYEIRVAKSTITITWTNSNVVDNVPIAILIQYGHATKNGGYIQGRDYINPAIKPIFDKLADEAWREVTNG